MQTLNSNKIFSHSALKTPVKVLFLWCMCYDSAKKKKSEEYKYIHTNKYKIKMVSLIFYCINANAFMLYEGQHVDRQGHLIHITFSHVSPHYFSWACNSLKVYYNTHKKLEVSLLLLQQSILNEWMYSVKGFGRSFRRACFFNILFNHCWNRVLFKRTILSNTRQVEAAPIFKGDIGKPFRTQPVPKEKYKETRLILPRCVQGNISCQRLVTWYIRASAYYVASDQSIKTRN